MAESWSGRSVRVERVICINPFLAAQRDSVAKGLTSFQAADEFEDVVIPEGHRAGGVESNVYNGYRQGLDSACIDVVITTRLPVGIPVVLATKRAPGKLFGNKWWMQGGALHSYRSIEDFLCERVQAECGVRPALEGFIGVFRTCADDRLGSTMNLCYVGYVPYEDVVTAGYDDDHTACRLLTMSDLAFLPDSEKYWYPMYVFRKAMTTMPAVAITIGQKVFARIVEKPELLDTLADRLVQDDIVE